MAETKGLKAGVLARVVAAVGMRGCLSGLSGTGLLGESAASLDGCACRFDDGSAGWECISGVYAPENPEKWAEVNVKRTWSRGVVASLVVVLLALMTVEVVTTIRGQSLTWDETDHIFAGYESWETKDFGLNPEHPPMVKLLATIPLLHLPLKVPTLKGRFFKTESYLDGKDLLFGNAPAYSAESLVFRVRLLPGLFALGLGLLVFFAAQEMFGTTAGLVALLLFVTEPNLLAHSAYVTTDMGLSSTMFATVYAFYRYAKRPTGMRLVVVGIAVGLCLAAKHSAVLLLPMVVCLALGEVAFRWRDRRNEAEEDAPGPELAKGEGAGLLGLKLAGALVAIAVIGVVLLWGFYGFRYSARPAGLTLSPTLAEYVQPLSPHEAKGILLLARGHVFPESWLYGLADVRAMANDMPSFFMGKVYAHGVWFYFPVLLTIKSTLGMMGLLLLSFWAIATGRLKARREVLFMIVPPAIYLAVAMESQLNIGARHVLPLWAFGCVLAAGGAAALTARDRRWAWVAATLVVMHAASSAMAYPNYMAYSNEAWGGPSSTYKYLSDSNTDWGQQLLAAKAYVDQRGIRSGDQCWMAYFVAPFVLPEDYGIPCKQLPTPDTYFNDVQIDVPAAIEGPVLISAGTLNGFELGDSVLNPYESFRSVKPTAYVQDGMFVFDGQFRVPLASALAYTQRSAAALKKGDIAEALRNAAQGEEIAPGAAQTELALGDAKAASGQRADALAAYERARMTIATMEPEGREVWGKVLEEKVRNVR